jgi:hypothetical protein
MSQKYEFYLFENGKVPGVDTSINIPADMLDAIKFDKHFVLVVEPGSSKEHLQICNEDDMLGFLDARAKALSWADKKPEPTEDELALLGIPGVERVPMYGELSDISPEPHIEGSGWKFYLKQRGSKEPGKQIDEADIALVDFSLDRVIAEHANGSATILDKIDDVREFYGEVTPEMVIEPKEMDAVNKAVDPNHYKGYIDDLQWIDAMSKIPSLREPARFIAALELQIRKYMDRNGAKDLTIQEWKKARFYLVYLVAYIENDYVCVEATEIHKRIQGL